MFTGGIGEISPETRSRICDGLSWTGLQLNESLNEVQVNGREGAIHKPGSRLQTYVIPTDEELLIARNTVR